MTVHARFATLDGRHDDAVAAGRRATELGNDGYFLIRPLFLTELGRALAGVGHVDEARAVLEEAIRLAHVKGSLRYEWRAQEQLDELGR